ncbi:MAG: hypothetical protein HY426_02945 [Candidatus Levybacteria bacterium]|nr:hypothetical protein [Candidatus Levybacteria bacterium]
MTEDRASLAYLQRKINRAKPPYHEESSSGVNFAEPIQGQVLDFKEPGEISVTNGETIINLGYSIDPVDKDSRYLNKYSISSVTGNSVSLEELLPEGWSVVFVPTGQKEAITHHGLKAIIVTGMQPTSPEFALSLLHEVSHAREDDPQLLDRESIRSRINSLKDINGSEGAQIIRSERNAWAFAIKKIKPFIDFRPDSQSAFSWVNVRREVRNSIGTYSGPVKLLLMKQLRVLEPQEARAA